MILRIPVSAWLASKITAFEQRGRRDVMMSRDLDDIVTVLIGRESVVADVRGAPSERRARITEAFQAWRNQPLVWDAMDGCVRSTKERLRLDAARCELASA